MDHQTTKIAPDHEEQWNCPDQNVIVVKNDRSSMVKYTLSSDSASGTRVRGPSGLEHVPFRERGITNGSRPFCLVDQNLQML